MVTLAAFVSACDDLIRVEQKPRLRGVRISLPPEQTPQLLRKLDWFAGRRDFQFSSDSVTSPSGTSHDFELRREDIWIVGGNPLSEHTEIVRLPDGTPEASMEIDEGTFEVGFFAGRIQPVDTELDDLVLDFIATVQTVGGVTAAERANGP